MMTHLKIKKKRKVNDMEELTYNIELASGKEFRNLRLNGNNYVSIEEVTEDDFDDLSEVTITDSEGNVQVLHNVELLQVQQYEDGFYFILAEMPEAKVRAMATEAQIMFTAIATDTLIEEV
jgi:hypothetical protein